MGKRLERFGEVRIIDETNGFGLDFVEKTESRFWSTTPDVTWEQYSKGGRIGEDAPYQLIYSIKCLFEHKTDKLAKIQTVVPAVSIFSKHVTVEWRRKKARFCRVLGRSLNVRGIMECDPYPSHLVIIVGQRIEFHSLLISRKFGNL